MLTVVELVASGRAIVYADPDAATLYVWNRGRLVEAWEVDTSRRSHRAPWTVWIEVDSTRLSRPLRSWQQAESFSKDWHVLRVREAGRAGRRGRGTPVVPPITKK